MTDSAFTSFILGITGATGRWRKTDSPAGRRQLFVRDTSCIRRYFRPLGKGGLPQTLPECCLAYIPFGYLVAQLPRREVATHGVDLGPCLGCSQPA